MLNPFHLSFIVPDKEQAKRFYTGILGCEVGRDNDDWFDILFFGHQITVHQATEKVQAYTIDHFGPVLEKEQWEAVSQRLEAAGVEYVAKPFVKTDSCGNESGKYLIKDPSGNILEFKYYDNFEKTVSENA
jgi:extradiol dioxygenase family protein